MKNINLNNRTQPPNLELNSIGNSPWREEIAHSPKRRRPCCRETASSKMAVQLRKMARIIEFIARKWRATCHAPRRKGRGSSRVDANKSLILYSLRANPAVPVRPRDPKISHISAIVCHSLPNSWLTYSKQTTYEMAQPGMVGTSTLACPNRRRRLAKMRFRPVLSRPACGGLRVASSRWHERLRA